MIRLAVAGLDDSLRRALAGRLPSTRLEPFTLGAESTSESVEESSDRTLAAFFAPAHPPDDAPSQFIRSAERFLRDGWTVTVEAGAAAMMASGLTEDAWDRFLNVAGGRFSVRNLSRYLPSRQLIRQQIEAGKLGLPALVRSHRWSGSVRSSRPENVVPPELIVEIDVAQWMMGSSAEVVYAAQSDGGDAVQIHLGFPNGGMALLDWGRLPQGDGYSSLSVIGAAGSAVADDHSNRQLRFAGGPAQTCLADETLRGVALLLEDFLTVATSVSEGGPDSERLRPTGDAWGDAVRVGRAAARSLETNRPIRREAV